MDFKVFFADGTTWAGPPAETPSKGVAAVIQHNDRVGRRVLKLQEWYLYCPSTEMWTDQPDAASALARAMREPWCVIRPGEYMREADFERILIAAQNDVDLPPRCGGPPHPAWGT